MPPEPHAPPRYRADVDGLRAVAVGGVVLFHYGFAPPAGGFAGVDVFFTISGFLIATVLEGDLARGRFSFASFYERRVRRIVPALLVVLFASGLACAGHLPGDLKRIGLGVMNASTFTSNVYFDSLADSYFAAGSLAIQPVLHTWSLGVEAQFYLAFPAFWLAVRRWPRARLPAVLALAAASFALSVWGVARWPQGAFFLLPARLWEFGLGAVPVLLPRPAWRTTPRAAAAALGLGLIGAGFAWLTPATPFPGAGALLPCCGTALAIQAGRAGPNPVGTALGCAPLAGLGRLSYALYLWHWPLLVLVSYGRFDPLPASTRLGLVAVALGLAWITHVVVERPVIARRRLRTAPALAAACGGGTALCFAVGLVLNLAGQNKLTLAHFPPDVLRLAGEQSDFNHRDCFVTDLAKPECRFGAAGAAPTVAIWGNSFAGMWTRGLGDAAEPRGAAGVSLWLSSCPPLLGASVPEEPRCEPFNAAVLRYLAAHPEVRRVVLAADWGNWVDRLPALAGTVDALAALGRAVTVARSPPLNRYDVPRTLALAAFYRTSPPPLLTEAEARGDRAAQDAALDAVRAAHPFAVIDPASLLCRGGTCAVQRDGRALYYDARHIDRAGAAALSGLFDPLFAGEPPLSGSTRVP